MQTLGLSSSPRPTDGLFKRLFWPEIANQYDVDLVGQQGFWVCLAVAVLSMVVLIWQGQIGFGLLLGSTYFLAALGVRERDIAAAVLIFLCYLLDRIAALEFAILGMVGGGNSILTTIATMLLFANVRATILSRRWQTSDTPAEISEFPERQTSSFSDRIVNQLPAMLWPRTRYVFYPLATILLLLSMSGVIGLTMMKHKQVQTPNSQKVLPVSPSE
ncbi:MAG TPA: hypothetical protein VL495_09935 [Edaphobacter sp.]|jgi:hypothetical protein|nr:hypothetical protein [Edaphobacter sp.]